MSILRASVKLLALVGLVLIIIPLQSLLLPFDRLAWRAARQWHRAVGRVLGITVECVGVPEAQRQVVLVGNHLSYLDVFVIGGLVRGSFVAKREVRAWPLFGFLATLQRTVFASRGRGDAARVVDQLRIALAGGRNLILFPEGTSSAGVAVLSFKSTAFSVFQDISCRALRLQPFTLELLRVDGHEVASLEDRNLYAYHGSMVLGPHLWRFMRGRGATIRVTFHPMLEDMAGADRKDLAARAQAAVASGLSPLPKDALPAFRSGQRMVP